MEITRTAYGTWNGGRFINYGEPLPDERWINVVQHAYRQGIRTFITADVYGAGAADELLGCALAGLPRDSYCLVGAVGHDFYKAQRQGTTGFPRFTDPSLRTPREFKDYLRMATEKSLQRCRVGKFDLLLLHNPDFMGYGNDMVWNGMGALREAKLADRIGIAPGPANGFTLDLLLSFERFGPLIDWAMIILNPLEPWPGTLVLPAAAQNNVKVMTRVVDGGGLFQGDVKPGHPFATHDLRTFRPSGWLEAGHEKLKQLRPFSEKYGVTLLQLACLWNLSQVPVECVIPTLMQEVAPAARSLESKVDELAALPDLKISPEDIERIARIGANQGCMQLKGANRDHMTPPEADKWGLSPDLEAVGRRWGIDLGRHLAQTHAPGST
jgi:aryl-alcohol dehydrogenase-like predicted oxidoreductase